MSVPLMAHWIEQFVFDCPSRKGSSWPSLRMTAKRYRAPNISPAEGLTLFFFHANSTHKEQWEPVIESLLSQSSSAHFKIREAWAFDWPSHGEAAILNRELLERRTEHVSVYDWVSGVVQFLRSEYMQRHHVVLCGHSAGATTAALSAVEFYPNLTPAGIIGLILVESAMMTPKANKGNFQALQSRMITVASSKRDSWKSRQEALLYLQRNRPWNKWDPKILCSYVEHGLYERDDGTVALKCDKKREMDAFIDGDPHFHGMACLGKLCRSMPVHAIWGERQDYIPDSTQTSLSDTTEGRTMASVTKVERAGHMIVQEQPIRLARAICHILQAIPSSSDGSRL